MPFYTSEQILNQAFDSDSLTLRAKTPVRRIVHKAEPIAIDTEFYGEPIEALPHSTTLRVMCQTTNDSSPDGLAVLYYMSESDIVLDPPGEGDYWQYLPIVPVIAGSASVTGFVQVGQAEICIPLYAPFYQIYFKSGSTYAGHLYIVSLEY